MTYDRTIAAVLNFAPPGHFYSPHPLIEQIEGGYTATSQSYENMDGIALNAAEQLSLFEAACRADALGPWEPGRTGSLRYFYDNFFFRFGDANALWHMAKALRPRRVIEVGSGFSTACWLDALQRLGTPCEVHCVEPYPDRLRELCAKDLAEGGLRLSERPVQELPLETFDALGAGDVLFIDSTHVSKSGSDVNHLVFRVLPRLAPGVVVHFHDVFWPFEYPKSWYLEGRSWNECFVLRAFLQFNSAFRIVRFNSYLAAAHPKGLSAVDPRFVHDAGGSIWLVKA
jgi:predicted O-methyltransferase YrrM